MSAYLVWYFTVGAFAYGLFYVFIARKRAREYAELSAGSSSNNSLRSKFLNWFLFYPIAFVIFSAVWPWVVWIEARGAVAGKVDRFEEKRPEFEVRDEFLICELAWGDIECLETVEDPLGAAPRVPFGHMNPAWEEFKSKSGNGVVWKFSGKHVGDWGSDWLREGYVVLNEDGTRPYFLTRLEYLGRSAEGK